MTIPELKTFAQDYLADKASWKGVPRELQSEERIIFEFILKLEEATVSNQQSAITDASVAHAVVGTGADVDVNAALDALGGKINAVIAALEGYGLVAQ